MHYCRNRKRERDPRDGDRLWISIAALSFVASVACNVISFNTFPIRCGRAYVCVFIWRTVESHKRGISPAEFRRMISRANKSAMTDRIEITRAETIHGNMVKLSFWYLDFYNASNIARERALQIQYCSLGHDTTISENSQNSWISISNSVYEYWKYLKYLYYIN